MTLTSRLQAAIEEPIDVDGVLGPGERQLRHRRLGARRRRRDEPDARRGRGALSGQGARATAPSSCTTRSSTARRCGSMVIRNDLRWATERGELRLEYQPIIDLETSRPIVVRGAAPLGASGPGPPQPRRVRAHRGGRWSHGRDRPLGHQRGVPRRRRVAGPGSCHRGQRQPRAQPAARRVAASRYPERAR